MVTLIYTVQKKWKERKLAFLFFIDVNGTFNHIPKGQLLKLIIEFENNDDLVTWAESFFPNRKIHLVINKYDNKETSIETGIPQGLLMSFILLLIYISGVFNKVSGTNFSVTFMSFEDDLRFIASGSLIKKLVNILEKVTQTILEWRMLNTLAYHTTKTEVVLFSKLHRQSWNNELQKAKVQVGNKKISMHKKATRQFRFWLDSYLNFMSCINERVRKAWTAEI